MKFCAERNFLDKRSRYPFTAYRLGKFIPVNKRCINWSVWKNLRDLCKQTLCSSFLYKVIMYEGYFHESFAGLIRIFDSSITVNLLAILLEYFLRKDSRN